MDTKVLNFSNTNSFVSDEYLQSKKVFDNATGPVHNASSSPVPNIENPFSIFYKTG